MLDYLVLMLDANAMLTFLFVVLAVLVVYVDRKVKRLDKQLDKMIEDSKRRMQTSLKEEEKS